MTNWYGFGGMCHHAAMCYHLGLATNRTVVLHYTLGDVYKGVIFPATPCTIHQFNGLPSWHDKQGIVELEWIVLWETFWEKSFLLSYTVYSRGSEIGDAKISSALPSRKCKVIVQHIASFQMQ